MFNLNEKELEARERVCLAIDVPTTKEALGLMDKLYGLIGMAKIGKELHTIAGNEGEDIIGLARTYDVGLFLDLKFHDTPNTVYGAAKAVVAPGVDMFNLHIASGETACKKALEGAAEGAEYSGIKKPKVIGVTVLTSLGDEDCEAVGLQGPVNDLVMRRAEKAAEWGLDGIVCAAKDVVGIKANLPKDFLYVTPAIKAPISGIVREGQKRVYTPGRAVQDCGNSILVVGGAITKADDMRQAAYEVLQDMAKYL